MLHSYQLPVSINPDRSVGSGVPFPPSKLLAVHFCPKSSTRVRNTVADERMCSSMAMCSGRCRCDRPENRFCKKNGGFVDEEAKHANCNESEKDDEETKAKDGLHERPIVADQGILNPKRKDPGGYDVAWKEEHLLRCQCWWVSVVIRLAQVEALPRD